MTITNFSPATQAAIDMLFGERDTTAIAAEEVSPIARAVAAAAQQLQHRYEGELDSQRLAEAMQLVLGNGVALHLDGSNTVQKGRAAYSQRDGACSCNANRSKGLVCEHLLAAELQQLTQGLLSGQPAQVPAPAAAAVPPASSGWDVHEAPVSCYLKFRVGHLELSYTMRDVDDNHLSARLTKILPKIHALAEAEDARREQLAAAQAEAKQQAQAAEQAERPAEASDLQQMIQQAVQHMLGRSNGNGSTAPAMPAEPEARYNDDGDKWCFLHEEWMLERSNAQGSWHSHPAEDEQGEYYCKGNGRPRRSRR